MDTTSKDMYNASDLSSSSRISPPPPGGSLPSITSKHNSELSPVQVLLLEVRIIGHHGVRLLDVAIIMQLPVADPHLPRRMEQSSPDVVEHNPRADSHADGLDGLDDAVDDVRARLEEVRVQQVEQVHHGVLAAQPDNAQGD